MKLRAPAIPLITVDPYFSVWSKDEHLNYAKTVHWTGKINSIIGSVLVDGVEFSFFGYHRNLRKSVIPSEMTVSLSELEDFISGDDEVSADFDAERLGHIISDFVRSLSERRQFIFMSRYYVADTIDTIASDLNLSRSMVNKELASIRTALKEKLESEGYSI